MIMQEQATELQTKTEKCQNAKMPYLTVKYSPRYIFEAASGHVILDCAFSV